MLLEPSIGHEAAVAGEDFRLRQRRRTTAFVRVAEDELPGLSGAPEPGVGSSPPPSITGCERRSR